MARHLRDWYPGRILLAWLMGLGVLIGPISTTMAQAATTANVAYVFDFGSGVNDTGGPGTGSGIFVNAITGGTIGAGNTGTYNGANFTNVPVSTIDANPATALTGFDTVLLYQVCDIASHPATITAINTFLTNGGKVMIFDADRCAPSFDGITLPGPADYSAFLFPFTTSSPGPRGASGSYTNVVASSLTTGLSVGAQTGDSVGDANTFTSHAGGWCASISATNTLGNNGFVEAFARTVSGGLVVFEGEDFWFTAGTTAHLKLVFDNILAQPFNPDSLPCPIPASGIKLDPATSTNPLGTSHTDTATVVDNNGTPLAGITVTFSVLSGPDAGLGGTAVTDVSGHATFTFTDTTAVGTDVVVASFTDSSGILEKSNQAVKIWTAAKTTLLYTGATTSDFNDPATVSATLTSAVTNAPIPGVTISFALDGDGSCTGTTDASGKASCSITPSLAAGTYPLTASFAGNANFQASTATAQFIVTLEETMLAYTGPTLIANAQPVTLSGVLKEDGLTPIAGRAVVLTLGSDGSAQTCTGTTDASGAASCTINPVNQPLGPGVITANFAGDTFYLPSSATANTLLFAFLAHGAFVVGDKSDTGSVEFWGRQWDDGNVLSGGAAPDSFKGFAENPSSTPPTCGGTYTTDPGNSSGPPHSIPSYMGVIVSSSVTKSGSTISGDVNEIVVVKTDPGYAPNPGHPGTGTVVAIFCG